MTSTQSPGAVVLPKTVGGVRQGRTADVMAVLFGADDARASATRCPLELAVRREDLPAHPSASRSRTAQALSRPRCPGGWRRGLPQAAWRQVR